ncbi:MAG: hypothetical protein ACFBWO_15280 [Paracoccaceae bacterium]
MHFCGVVLATAGFMGLLYVGLMTQGCDPLEMLDGKTHVALGRAHGPVACRLEKVDTAFAIARDLLGDAPEGAREAARS